MAGRTKAQAKADMEASDKIIREFNAKYGKQPSEATAPAEPKLPKKPRPPRKRRGLLGQATRGLAGRVAQIDGAVKRAMGR